MTLIDILERHVLERPDATAYVFLEEDGSHTRRSFAALLARVQAIASSLQACTAQGDRVLLMYQPGLDFVEAILACFAAGVVAVPMQPMQNRHVVPRLSAIMQDAGAYILLSNRKTQQAVRRIVPEADTMLPALWWVNTDLIGTAPALDFRRPAVHPADLAFLQYTSGSTGAPKGVMVSHSNVLHNQAIIQSAFGHDESTVFVGWLPLYHDMGLIGNVFQPLYAGIPAVLFAPMTFLLSPVSWLKAIAQWGATTSGAPSFAYELCVHRITEAEMRGVDLSSWRVAFNGAELVKAHVIDAFSRKFAAYGFRPEAFYPCYGMAEATLFVTGGTPAAPVVKLAVDPTQLAHNKIVPRADSTTVLIGCGRTHGDHEVRVVEPETRRVLADNQVGELWVSGPSVACGYWGKPALSQEILHAYSDKGAGPYLRTGDLGFRHAGELFITGRLKDVIIVRGQNHYPDDIESTVYRGHEALREAGAAAFALEGEQDTRLVVVAEVQRHVLSKLDTALLQDLGAKARKDVSDTHGLRLHELVLIKPSTLPRTSSGKIRRSYCRELYLTGGLERIVPRSVTATLRHAQPRGVEVEA